MKDLIKLNPISPILQYLHYAVQVTPKLLACLFTSTAILSATASENMLVLK